MVDFFEKVGSNVEYHIEDRGHAWPTDVKPRFWEFVRNTCTNFEFPVGNCGYDTPGMILEHLLPNIPGSTVTEIQPKEYDWRDKVIVKQFDQSEFIERGWFETSGMAKWGYVVYPK